MVKLLEGEIGRILAAENLGVIERAKVLNQLAGNAAKLLETRDVEQRLAQLERAQRRSG